MILATVVVCVALVMSVTLFGLSVWLIRSSLAILSGYLKSLMDNGEQMLAAIDEQIMVMRRQMDQADTFIAMESGEMFGHEPDEDDDD
jgi:hypothetical protein